MNIFHPILRSLHWLPIPEIIDFKLLLLTFKSLNDVAPPYMEELLDRYRPTTTLRSANLQSCSWHKLNITLKPMGTELFHTQLLRYGIPCQSVYALVVSWALSNQKIETFLFKRFFSCNFILFCITYYYYYYYYYYFYYYYYHNYNKILKSDWLSTALISALIGQFNRTVRVMPK